MNRPAWIHSVCPRCGGDSIVLARGSAPPGPSPECPRCGLRHPRSSPPADPALPLSRCCVCGGEEFYTQKDFNRRVGLQVVIATGIVAFLVMVLAGHLWGLLVLGAVLLLDLAVYRRLPEVSVCYLCQSVYHGFPANPEHRGFYMGNEERFKALRQAWLEGLSR